jgi:hypothetical protein
VNPKRERERERQQENEKGESNTPNRAMPPKTSQGRGDEDDEEYVNRGELYDGGNKDSLGAQHDSEEQSDPITRPRTIQNEADRIKLSGVGWGRAAQGIEK